MKGSDFLRSKWMEMARQPGAAAVVGRKFSHWLRHVRNLGLAARARQLWAYFQSNKASAADKLIVLAALLYLVTPLDMVPDWLPALGLLDDLGVATFAIRYVLKKIDADQEIQGTQASDGGE